MTHSGEIKGKIILPSSFIFLKQILEKEIYVFLKHYIKHMIFSFSVSCRISDLWFSAFCQWDKSCDAWGNTGHLDPSLPITRTSRSFRKCLQHFLGGFGTATFPLALPKGNFKIQGKKWRKILLYTHNYISYCA
jgi:hypothetical protein